jgi:general secretion pathway protein D
VRVAFAAQWVSSRRPLPGPSHTHRYALGGLLLLWAGLFFPAAPLSAQTVTLNLKDADIRALVSTVADVTGRNFIVDPRVKGKVTVISGTPIQQKELYQLFLSVLAVHGFATVPAGEAIKIVPAASGKSDSTPVPDWFPSCDPSCPRPATSPPIRAATC